MSQGIADRRFGKKASGPGACFPFPPRPLSLPLSLSLCTSLVVPQRQQTRRLAVVSRFTPIFGIISVVHTLARLGIWDLCLFCFPFLFFLTTRRDLAQ